MKMTLATENDVDRLMDLIKACVEDMASQGIYQWNEQYPNLQTIRNDVESESTHILEGNNGVIAAISMNEEQPPEYRSLSWLDQEGRVLVLHRLAVNPKWQKQGIGGRILDYAENYAVDNGYTSIRLDTYSGNPRALRLYERHQYRRVGKVRFPGRDLPFFCYEKNLRKRT